MSKYNTARIQKNITLKSRVGIKPRELRESLAELLVTKHICG